MTVATRQWLAIALLAAGCRAGPEVAAPSGATALGMKLSGALPHLDGQRAELADVRGKVALVDFWATWCEPCRKELPAFDALAKEYAGRLQVVAVSVDEDDKPIGPFVAGAGLHLDVLWDKGGVVADRYHVSDLPTTLVLDKTGTVRFVHSGGGDEAAIRAEVAQLVGP